MSSDVVEGERERGQQSGDEAVGIEAKGLSAIWFCSDDADDERNASDRQRHGNHFLQRKLLLAAGHYVEQNPHRSGVLHDDGRGDVRSLNRDVIEVIRDRDAERTQKEAVSEIARGELDPLPSLRQQRGEEAIPAERMWCGSAKESGGRSDEAQCRSREAFP